MNVFMDKPSAINHRFHQLFAQNPQQATDWFYQISQSSNYIQTAQIAKNIVYQAPSRYGSLDITINLSKPEKNPRDIAAARLVRSSGYPACQLCVENEGYAGRIGYAARANHRMIRLTLTDEPWYFQYSPYSYYPEHCIILAEQHRDMVVNRLTFDRLLEFITLFPHYFAGSNADLPIVGGSILTHDHYQGGRYELPMARAVEVQVFSLEHHPEVHAAILNWPMSVIRLRGAHPDQLADAADRILGFWRGYSDEACQILAHTDGVPHNTITPIARRRGQDYELDLVLRNNRQSDEHPLGIFHPHADVHHIKKENIGLIEVMGLAVLPARLLTELDLVERYLLGEPVSVAEYHQDWADSMRADHPAAGSADEVRQWVRQGVAQKFERVLSDAGVYKQDEAGMAGMNRLIDLIREI
jgi:UDPglucose--hexose-1-phosphate uridylyltransferase